MKNFFGFFQREGVEWWHVDALARKVNGERGAPLGSRFACKYAFHVSRAGAAFEHLEKRIKASGRADRRYDLVTRESPARAGARVLLADDLDGIQVDELLDWWSGAAVILETSRNNHQALLVTPCGLQPEQHRAALRALAFRFDGDPGAASVHQLHRLPGSSNWKEECLLAGGPFITRATAVRPAIDTLAASAQLGELLRSAASLPKAASPPRAPSASGERDQSNSGRAISWAMSALRRGTPHDEILQELATTWLRHHSVRDWPSRTLRRAREYLRTAGGR